MPLRLIPPGGRKGNPFYLVRGTVGERSIEVSTKTRDRATARSFARDLETELAARRVPGPGEAVGFAAAARLYAAFKGLDLDEPKANPGRSGDDAKRINKLIIVLDADMVAEINHARLVEAANLICPDLSGATKNREVMRPAAAILHYAADSGYRDWLRVKLFEEPRPATRAVTRTIASALIAAAPDEDRKQLLLLWLFHHGTRITQTLGLTWEDGINLADRSFRFYDKKARDWQVFPLHSEVFEMLAAIPEEQRHGRLWPWRTRSGVYRWLKPLAVDLGLKFTPHMARHSVGTWLNAQGEGLRTIMDALGHKDAKSSTRYQKAGIEILRAASERVGDFRGNATADRRKAQS